MLSFFTTGTFWFIMGILSVGVFAGAKILFEERGFAMSWWKWTLVVVWWLLLFVTAAAPMTLLAEREPKGAWGTLGIFGVLTVVLGVGLWRVLASGKKLAAGK
jgi:hypothetical protein